MIRTAHLTAITLLALAVSTTGCYTKVGFPDPYADLYGTDLRYEEADYWTDYYYAYLPAAPWQAYAGHSWWYQDYHRYWVRHGHYLDWDEPEVGVHRNDRGPGIRSTGGGGGGGRSVAPPPAPTDSGPQDEASDDSRSGQDSTNPSRERAVSQEDSGRTKSESTEPTRPGRRR